MDEAWKVLCAAGLPDGPARPQPADVDLGAVRRAVVELAAHPEGLTRGQREPLLGWLKAFAHHHPRRFERELGAAGRALIAALDTPDLDANRYLKLRRIAVENLSRWL